VNLVKTIESKIEEALSARGYALVRIQISGIKKKTLQIMLERTDENTLSVDDCSKASRLISVLMDVENPIPDPYILEVSSAGLERPLVKPQDFRRFCHNNIIVLTHLPVEGRKKFQGCLTEADDNQITLDLPKSSGNGIDKVVIELENIRNARLAANFNNSEI
jgi:ribosome maturation factor RimP